MYQISVMNTIKTKEGNQLLFVCPDTCYTKPFMKICYVCKQEKELKTGEEVDRMIFFEAYLCDAHMLQYKQDKKNCEGKGCKKILSKIIQLYKGRLSNWRCYDCFNAEGFTDDEV